MILNFPQRDCLRTRKVSKLHCLQSYWLSFPLFMSNHCNKLSIKVLKHTIFSTKLPHWHRILVIFRMYGWVPKEMQFWIYIWEELFRGQIFCQTKKGDHKKFWSKENHCHSYSTWVDFQYNKKYYSMLFNIHYYSLLLNIIQYSILYIYSMVVW